VALADTDGESRRETAPEQTSGAGETASDADEGVTLGPLSLSGNLNQRFRYRKAGSDTDQDLYGYVNLDATYPGSDAEGRRPYKKIGFNLQASYNLDVDSFESAGGGSQGGSFFPFTDISNTFGDRFRGFVHSAHLEIEDFAAFEELRLGRQQIYREESFLLDGALLRTKRWKTLAFEVFGGVPAHLYESSPSGDALGGFSVDSKPLSGLMVGADYVYVRDDSDDTRDTEDQLYRVRARYDVSAELSLDGSASWVDSRDRRQQLGLRYVSQELGFLANVRALRQNAVVGFQTSELSPYLFIQGDYAPFYQYQVDLDQPLGDHFNLGGGVHLRHLEDDSDEGLYNHSFRNYYLSFEGYDLWTGGRASLRGDLWDSDGDDIYTFGFELEQKVLELLRIRLGTSYSLYRIDLFTGTERERDRIYYAKLRWHILPRFDFDTDYQYEKDSRTEYHTVTTGLRLSF
jgi:hypothetical protein